MNNYIRACAAVSAGIVFAILCVAVFGEIRRPKAIGVVVVFSLCTAISVFAYYLKFNLATQSQRLIGVVGAVFFSVFFVCMLYENPFRTGWHIASDPWRNGGPWIVGLAISNAFPLLAFRYDKFIAPAIRWIRQGSRPIAPWKNPPTHNLMC